MTWYNRRLILLLIILLIPVYTFSKVYLVSVGIADYPGIKNDLRLPARDAQTITQLYNRNTGVESIQLLNQRATVAATRAAMNRLYAVAGPNDIVVFFFSGHGYQGGFALYDGGLSYQEIRKAMARSKSRNKMVFADACFSGRIRQQQHSSQSEVNAAKQANVMLFLSSRSNEYSLENRIMKNGFFTTYLERGLRGRADKNRNRIITARELFDYVHNQVVRITDDQQHPVMWGNFPHTMTVMQW